MDSEGNGRCLIGDRYIEETSSCRDSYDGLLLCYESGPIPLDCSAISFLQGIMSRAGIEDISIEGLIRRGLLIRMGNNILVTNAFEMLTSNRGGPVIKCALFPDDMAIEFLDHAVYDGSILDQIRELYASGIGMGYLICGILVLLVLILVFYLKDDKKKASE